MPKWRGSPDTGPLLGHNKQTCMTMTGKCPEESSPDPTGNPERRGGLWKELPLASKEVACNPQLENHAREETADAKARRQELLTLECL